MRVKLLMQWDIEDGKESAYYDFIVNEFLPLAKRLGLDDIQFWFTTYGNTEQIQASGITSNLDKMMRIINGEEWDNLITRLTDLVSVYQQKVIPATNGFQL